MLVLSRGCMYVHVSVWVYICSCFRVGVCMSVRAEGTSCSMCGLCLSNKYVT